MSLSKPLSALLTATAAFAMATSAQATVVGSDTDVVFTGGSTSFSFMGGTFTFADAADGSGNIAVSTGGSAAVAATGFPNPEPLPTSFQPFSNAVVDEDFGTNFLAPFTMFPDPKVSPFSSTEGFFALRVDTPDGPVFGFARTQGGFFGLQDFILLGFAFESEAGVGIQFGADIEQVIGVPEPGMIGLLGLGLVGLAAMRRRA